MTDDTLMDRIFAYFDKGMRQYLDLENFVMMMSLFIRGSLEEKIDYCFQVYNLLKDGFLIKDTIVPLMRKYIVRQPADEDVEEAIR
ncbi:hypothetical protein L9F63_015121, partial [Diploptera punctata]